VRLLVPFFLFLTIDSYLSYSLFGSLRTPYPMAFGLGVTGVSFLFLSQAWLFYIFFQSGADEKIRFEKPLQKLAFHSMGVISFLFTFTLLRDLLALPFLIFNQQHWLYGATPTEVILALSLLCLIWGLFNARFRVVCPRIEIPILKLPEALAGLRIVQLSDVHLGTGPNTEQIGALVDRALGLKPDIIVLTGDIIDGATAELKPELAELSRLKAPHGVYFVLGNHECYWNHENSITAMQAIGVKTLMNEGIEIQIRGESVYIAGVNDPALTQFKGQGPEIPTPPANSSFKLLLAHQPQIAKKVAEHPYHLQLSGHTHGGQFFPWNLFVKRMYLHPGGIGRIKDLWVYVSHGSGYWGPPIRLGTDGEVTEILIQTGQP